MSLPTVTKILKNPVLYFFVLGFAVFGLHAFLNMDEEPGDDPFVVEVTSADIEWLRSSWESRTQRKPTPVELNGLIDAYIREEILSREAHAMGLDEQDLVIKRRLVQKLLFVFEDLAEAVEPTDEELRAYAEEHREEYEVPPTISFTQVYFSPDKRRDAATAAESALGRLQAGRVTDDEAVALGDAIMLDASYRQVTRDGVIRAFGPGFAGELFDLEGEGWQGPIGSSFGLHLVRIDGRTEAAVPDFESVRERVRYDFMYDRKREVVDKTYDSVKSRYTILVEGLPHE